MANALWWYKDVPIHLDSFTTASEPILHVVPHDKQDELPKQQTTPLEPHPQGSVYHLALDQRSFVLWRIVNNDRVLELRHCSTTNLADEDYQRRSAFNNDNATGPAPPVVSLFPDETYAHLTPVQFVFPAPILPTVTFFEEIQTKSLHCFLLTTTGIHYRLVFPRQNLFYANPLPLDFCTFYRSKLLANKKPVLVHAIDLDSIVVACSNGSLVQLDRPRGAQELHDAHFSDTSAGDFRETELSEFSLFSQVKNYIPANLLTSALKLAGPSTSASQYLASVGLAPNASDIDSLTQPVALASFVYRDINVFYITLCRDRKLRVWSPLSDRRVVRTIQLPTTDAAGLVREFNPSSSAAAPSESALRSRSNLGRNIASATGGDYNALSLTGSGTEFPLPSTPKTYVRVIENHHDDSLFDVVVFVSTEQDSFFAIYSAKVDYFGQLKRFELSQTKPCHAMPNEDLVDFSLRREPVVGGDADAMDASASSSSIGESADAIWTLWTLWDRQRESIVRFTSIIVPVLLTQDDMENSTGDGLSRQSQQQAAAGERWHTVATTPRDIVDIAYFDSLLLTSSRDVPEIFTDYIFYPGRFSRTIVAHALRLYAGSIDPRYRPRSAGQSSSFTSTTFDNHLLSAGGSKIDLRQQVAETVAQHIRIAKNPETGALLFDDYRKHVKTEWLRFLALCIQLEQQGGVPVGLALGPWDGMVMVVKRSGVSMVRVCDELEVLFHHFSGEFDLAELLIVPARMLEQSYPHIAMADARQYLRDLLEAVDFLVSRIPADKMSLIEEDLLATLGSPINVSVDNFAQEIYDRHLRKLVEDKTRGGKTKLRIVNALKSCPNLAETVTYLLTLLNSPPNIAQDDAESPPPRAKTSILMDAFITTSIRQIIQSRYIIARNLFCTLAVIVHLEPKKKLMDDPVSTFSSCMATLHVCAILKWSVEQMVAGEGALLATASKVNESVVAEEDEMIRQLSGLTFAEANTTSVATFSSATAFLSYSFIHTLLHHHYPVYIPTVANPAQPMAMVLTSAAATFLHQLKFLGAPPSPMVTTTLAMTKFAHRLEVFGYTELMRGMVRYLARVPGVLYVLGKCYLKEREYEKAKDCFERAAIGAVEKPEDSESEDDLSSILPTDVYRGGLPSYFRHIAELFEERHLADHAVSFCRMALDAIASDVQRKDPAVLSLVKTLWFKIFRNSLEQLLYEEAYMALLSNPDETTKRDCLRHLVVAMCENDQVKRLCQFSFVGLQNEVERVLWAKAKASDATRFPNYYKVLYSYHIFRGDFRNASSVMYQHARRLAAVGTGNALELVSEQARSYLAAINALCLVDRSYAWIFINRDGLNDDRKRKKLKSTAVTVEGAEAPDGKKDLDIIELADIRKEYTLALARLQLAKHYPDLKTTSSGAEAEDVVSLFVRSGMYDNAISTAVTFGIDLRGVFESLTEKCMRLMANDRFNKPIEGEDWLFNDESVMAWDGTASDRAWKLLQKYLEQHDDETTNYCYRAAVLEKILATDPNVQIPPWLTQFYKKHNPEDLVRICMKYELIEEAAQFALQIIQSETLTVYLITYKTASRWLPYSVIDQLLRALQDLLQGNNDGKSTTQLRSQDKQRIEALRKGLLRELDGYFKKVDRESEETVRSVMAVM